MTTPWQRAIAVARASLAIYASVTTSAPEREAIEWLRNLDTYQRQQLEQHLRKDGDSEAATWVSRNS